MVLDREQLISRVERGMTTAADADVLRPILFGRRGKGHAKLTPADVREMRMVWRSWQEQGTASRRGPDSKGYGALGHIYGVCASTARDIVKWRTWRHCGGPIEAKP